MMSLDHRSRGLSLDLIQAIPPSKFQKWRLRTRIHGRWPKEVPFVEKLYGARQLAYFPPQANLVMVAIFRPSELKLCIHMLRHRLSTFSQQTLVTRRRGPGAQIFFWGRS